MKSYGLSIAMLMACVVVAILLCVPTASGTVISLECHKFWRGPNADNNIFDCLSHRDRLKSQWRLFVLPILNAVLLLLFVTFPLVFCCVACCRGVCCTPATEEQTVRARCCTWLWIFYALLWGVAVFFLVIFGAGMLIHATPVLFDDTLHGPLDYFNFTAERILDFASNWSTGERVPIDGIPLDLTDFRTVHEKATDVVNGAQRNFFKYLDLVSTVTYVVGSIGFVLALLILPFAWFRCCVPFFPLALSCLYWVFGALFSFLGVVVTLLAYLSFVTCGEVELHYKRQPGIFQWYAVPYCQREFNFTKINAEIRDKEISISHDVCTQLLKLCDNDADIPFPNFDINSMGVNLPAGFSARDVMSSARRFANPLSVGNVSRNTIRVLHSSSINRNLGGLSNNRNGLPNIPNAVPNIPNAVPNIPNVVPNIPDGLPNIPDGLPNIPGGLPNIPGGLPNFPNGLPNFPNGLPNFPNGLPDIPGGLPGGLDYFLRPFRCGKGITNASECSDFGIVASVLLSTSVKPFIRGCPDPKVSCTLLECSANCSNKQIKSIASDIMGKVKMVHNASIAFSYARPLLECDFVLDKLVGALTRCGDLKTGSFMLGTGFFLGGLVFGLAIYIMFRGACIWKGFSSSSERS